MIKVNAAYRLLASAEVTAEETVMQGPAIDYQKENHDELKQSQNDHQKDEDKEAQSPSSDMSKTSVSDNTSAASMLKAMARKLKAAKVKAASTPNAKSEGDTADVMYADRLNTESDPLTMDEEDACLASLIEAESTVDGDYPPGFTPKFNVTEDPKTTGYTSASGADNWESDATEVEGDEVLSDADPRLFNLAQQPLG